MALLDFLLSSTTPLTTEEIATQAGREISEIEDELAKLLSENNLRKREFVLKDGSRKCVYWPSSLIPFIDQEPIITNPFEEPFNHQGALERLSDQQLLQEKTWLQTRLRKISSEYENLQHLANLKLSQEDEAKIDELADKWMSAIHDMLNDFLSKLKQTNANMTMSKLLNEIRIDPKTVKWNAEDEDFEQ